MSQQRLSLDKVLDMRQDSRTFRRGILLGMLLVGIAFLLLAMAQRSAASATADAKAYLPVVLANYQGTQPSEGIRGRVTANGSPVAGASLDLRLWDDNDEETVATTTTDADGNYLFSGIDTPGPGEGYYVRYGPNHSEPSLVSWWFGPDIDDYTSGMLVEGGDLDIANVDLKKPDDGATESLPATFSWERRGLPGDSYRVNLFDPDSGQSWSTVDLGDTGSFTASNLPPDIKSGKLYGWYMEVFNGPGNSYGESYESRELTLSFSGLLQLPETSIFSGFKNNTSQDGKTRRAHD